MLKKSSSSAGGQLGRVISSGKRIKRGQCQVFESASCGSDTAVTGAMAGKASASRSTHCCGHGPHFLPSYLGMQRSTARPPGLRSDRSVNRNPQVDLVYHSTWLPRWLETTRSGIEYFSRRTTLPCFHFSPASSFFLLKVTGTGVGLIPSHGREDPSACPSSKPGSRSAARGSLQKGTGHPVAGLSSRRSGDSASH